MELRTRPAFVVSPEEKIDKLLKRLPKVTTAVVIEGNKYLGIVTDLTLRFARSTPDKKIRTIAWKAPLLSRKMTIEQICENFLHGYRELPIEEGGSVRIVAHTDVLSALLSEGRIPKLRAAELAKPLERISQAASIAQAAALMYKKGVQHLAVVDDGKIVGIVSSADITQLLKITKERPPIGREKAGLESIALKSVLAKEPESIAESATTVEVARKMAAKDLSVLLIGNAVISAFDIMRAALPTREAPIEIVGLAPEDASLRGDIRRECAATIAKVEKFLPIPALRLAIKKHNVEGRRAKWSMRAAIPRTRIAVSAFAWDPFVALHYVLREIERLAARQKEQKGAWQRTKKKRALAAQLRLGEEVGRPIK